LFFPAFLFILESIKICNPLEIRYLKSAQISGTKHIRNPFSIDINSTHADPNTTLMRGDSYFYALI